jgi:hypothetical protein
VTFDGWLIAAYLAGAPVAQRAEPMFAYARDLVARNRAPDFSLPLLDDREQAFLALVHRATLWGDSAQVLFLLKRLGGARATADPSDPLPATLSASLGARLALLARDTTQAIALLQLAVSRPAEPYIRFFPLTSMSPERMLLVELLAARREQQLLDRWLGSFTNSWSLGDVLYSMRVRRIRAASHR